MSMIRSRRYNAVFRVDASLDIGTGHVMRCLTLADAMEGVDFECRFVCRDHPGSLIGLIKQRGFAVHVLPPNAGPTTDDGDPKHALWLGCDWLTDALQTRAVLDCMEVDWLIIDHYALDARWEEFIRPVARSIMVIDDLADRRHDCDVLLDQSFGREAETYQAVVSEPCRILVGSRYALLRPQFAEHRASSLMRRKTATPRTIMISLGGVDKDNLTHQVLCTLERCSLPERTEIYVVMGPHAPWKEMVRDKSVEMPWVTRIMMNVENMAGLMAQSDMAIGAAGSTSWERCALGLPTIMMIAAENQKEVGQRLASAGAAVLVEPGSDFGLRLNQAVDALSSDLTSLVAMSESAAAICDGEGGERVARVLIADNVGNVFS
jgi:UDP-2,4-diacetamido-2,4,6-trideoxy-beta-L-altropyranose hydrolase